MLTLSNLRHVRTSMNYPRSLLSSVSHIRPARLRDIELRKAEPWFDEALTLTKLLNLSSVYDLIAPSDLTSFEYHPRYFEGDVRFWERGVRLTLPMALRLAHRFGVARPDDLDIPALTKQIWDILSATERHPEAPGWCAWCQSDIVAGDPHSTSCLPTHLWGSRASRGFTDEAPIGEPRPAMRGKRAGAAFAHGLKSIRLAHNTEQTKIAAILEITPNHYSRIERCEQSLTLERASILSERLGISRDLLYLRPESVPVGTDIAPFAKPRDEGARKQRSDPAPARAP